MYLNTPPKTISYFRIKRYHRLKAQFSPPAPAPESFTGKLNLKILFFSSSMDFDLQDFNPHNHYNHVFPTSSSSSLHCTYFSHQPIIDGLWGGVGSPSSVAPLHGELFPPYSVYGGRGCHRLLRDRWGLEAVQWRPPSPEIGEDTVYDQPMKKKKKKIIVLGKPTSATVSGSKRKAPPQSPSNAAGLSGFCSNKSYKITEEWRCAVCDISAPCERSLNEHLIGKKHLAKVESLKGINTGADIGLGVIKNPVKKQRSEIKGLKGNNTGGDIGLGLIKNSACVSVNSKDAKKITEGGKITRKKFKFWCKMCKTGAHDENVMRAHKKGKKHTKNRRKKARAKTRLGDRKNT